MSSKDQMLRRMQDRATAPVREGDPIVPDGPTATTEDMQEFKRLAHACGYVVKFGKSRALTRPNQQVVELTAKCTTGILSDEFLHCWNNFAQNRGRYLDAATAIEHNALCSTFRLSGSSNDRRFHQLELRNYAGFLAQSDGPIPVFMWRTFSVLKPVV
jgi:hypothetical protein